MTDAGSHRRATEGHYPALARLHSLVRPMSYLEIGVRAGSSLRLATRSAVCIGVDPAPQLEGEWSRGCRVFPTTSDAFFAQHDLTVELGGRPLDMAFLDGMHLFDFVLRDVINIERHSSARTVLVIHDCTPLDARTSARERETDFWTGDVWKIVPCLARYRPGLLVSVLDVEAPGLCVVTGLDRGSEVLAARYQAIIDEFVPQRFDDYERAAHELAGLRVSFEQAVRLHGLDRGEAREKADPQARRAGG